LQGTYTLTIDGLRGAVLQMIAHGFVVVGLFFISDIILDDMKHELSKWVVYVHNHHFASMFLLLVLASVAY
jgi:NADH-quinone oxidoreductase subunit M